MFDMMPYGWNRSQSLLDSFADFEKNFFGEMGRSFSGFNTDIRDNGNEYVLEAELPGFNKEDISVEAHDGMLTISAKHEEKQETEVIAQTKIILPYCVMIALYLFLMSRIGYVVSTVVFMMVSLLYLKFKSKIGMVIISIVTTILIYLMFSNFLGVILPRAAWFRF